MVSEVSGAPVKAPVGGRWGQLVFGIVIMAMVANLQYGWTLFVNPIQEKHGWGMPLIQVAFAVFIVAETWLAPFFGWFVDKYGPRSVVVAGGILVGVAWVINAFAASLFLLYVGAALGGVGAGAVYATSVGNALKWFPDKRGLAAGLTAAGFGGGSAVTIIPIAGMINNSGYEQAFLFFGILQGVVVVVMGMLLAKPPTSLAAMATDNGKPKKALIIQNKRSYRTTEMIRQPLFWLLYLMFVSVAAGGLIATAEIGPMAKDWMIAGTPIGDIPVSAMGITLPAITFALAIDRVLNGITRPFFGWVSDHIGREQTMFICFFLEFVGIIALWEFGRSDPWVFVLLTGLVFFAWGEIYSLFPSTCADTFGTKYAAGNAGMLYTAKGTASLVVPIANVLHDTSGSWGAVLYFAAGVNLVAAILALFVLLPWRKRFIERDNGLVANGEVPDSNPDLVAQMT